MNGSWFEYFFWKKDNRTHWKMKAKNGKWKHFVLDFICKFEIEKFTKITPKPKRMQKLIITNAKWTARAVLHDDSLAKYILLINAFLQKLNNLHWKWTCVLMYKLFCGSVIGSKHSLLSSAHRGLWWGLLIQPQISWGGLTEFG